MYLVNNSVGAETSDGVRIYAEAEAIKQYRRDLYEIGSDNFSYSTNYNYYEIVENSRTRNALYIRVEPYHYINDDCIIDLYGYKSCTPEMQYGIRLFSYLVDLESSKVIWLFENSDSVNLFQFDFNSISRIIYDSMINGLDTKFSKTSIPLK